MDVLTNAHAGLIVGVICLCLAIAEVIIALVRKRRRVKEWGKRRGSTIKVEMPDGTKVKVWTGKPSA
ncbi:MAG: hypothetical protein NT025_01130 [bacterium]|nr:hypothetical protein [bacterium]